MTRIAATKLFLMGAYKNPFWDIATAVFLSLLSLMATYQLSSPEEQARLETSINEREAWDADAGRLCTLHLEMLSAMNAVTQPLNQHQEIYKGMIVTGLLPDRERIEENYNLVTKGKKQLELLAARLKGVHFRVPVHDEQARKYEALLATDLSILKLIEDFCAAFLADDVEKFAQQVRETGSRLSVILKEKETIDALDQGIDLKLEEQSNSRLTENKRIEAQATILAVKRFAHIPAAIICIGYLIAFRRGVNKVRNNPSGVSPRQKRRLPRPKREV